jgi:hypothetical protein
MRRSLPFIVAVVMATLSGATPAQEATTRDRVRAELAQATRDGTVQAAGDLGRTLRDVAPDRYPGPSTVPAKSRKEVVAEYRVAHANGELPLGDTGLTERDVSPGRFPPEPVEGGKTRSQVRTELADAILTGDIVASGDLGLTLREQFPRRYAAPARLHDSSPDTFARR